MPGSAISDRTRERGGISYARMKITDYKLALPRSADRTETRRVQLYHDPDPDISTYTPSSYHASRHEAKRPRACQRK
jgi:hypothetical protein